MKKIYAIILSFGLMLAPVQHAKAEEMSWGGVTNMVMGISTGIVGSSILLNCKASTAIPSLWLFMAGSLGYILAEMFEAHALNAHLKAVAVDLEEAKAKLKEGDTIQRLSLEQQLETEKKKLDYVKKRKGWMYVVGAFYLAATTSAIIELAAVISSAGIYTGLGLCTGYKEAKWWNYAIRGALIGAFMGGSLKSADTNGWVAAGGGLVSGALMIINPVSEFMEAAIGPTVETALGRSITFGVFTALTTATIIDLEITQGVIEKNIDDINLVLRTQYPPPDKDGFNGPSPESVGGGVTPISASSKLKNLNGFYAVTPAACASNMGANFSVNSSNCKKPMVINRPKLSGAFGSSTLQSTVNMGADYVDALAAGNMARAEVLAGSLGNMAGRLKIERDNALKKYNQLAKQNKKKVIDFDKEVKAMTASMSANLSKSLASQGIDPKSMMKASTGGDKKPLAAVSSGATPVAAAPEVPVEDLGTATETPAEETASAPAPTLEESLENFESNESDISPQKQVSIFKQVSNRYILNYNRFFREEEPTPEAAPVEVKAPVPEKAVTQPAR
jgi:hypothetical protein